MSIRRALFSRIPRLNYGYAQLAYSTLPNDIGQPTPATHPEMLCAGELTPGISVEEYISRRKKLMQLLPEGSVAVMAASPVKMMTDVVPYIYRQDADYSYITGCQQPGGIAVLGHDFGLCMFMPEATEDDVQWQGPVADANVALDTFKADEAHPISKLNNVFADMIKKSSKMYHNPNTLNKYTKLDAFQEAASRKKIKDVSYLTHQLRWVKSKSELKLMRESASIACQALLQTMLFSNIYPHESSLAATFEYESKMRGAQRMAFNPVVGSGSNASIIHYSRNDRKIKDGELVLMDVGCEFHGYVSDLTRTWPTTGHFSAAQEDLYEMILETNKECINLCKPGANIREIHAFSVTMMRKGLKKLGILKDEESGLYGKLNPTCIGHYLGMDVHDCSSISYNHSLEPGVVITIEPGIYIPSNFDCPERFRGIGIRVEDEVMITESGNEILTASMPKETKHIQSLLSDYSSASLR